MTLMISQNKCIIQKEEKNKLIFCVQLVNVYS